MTINERFGKIIRTLYGGNKRAFATDIGIAATVIENIVGKRQGKPSFDVVEKVCALENINTEWLITGKGDAFDFRPLEERNTTIVQAAPSATTQTAPLFELIREKDIVIREQAVEIGQLRERISQLERDKEKSASVARSSGIASAG